MKRLVACLIAIPLLAVLSLALFARIHEHIWLHRHPAPGRLVDLGGYRLHLNCTGQGRSTVFLEAGLGDSSLIWNDVQKAVSRFDRVCSYDRGGLGWSDPSPLARTPMNETSELHELLRRVGIHHVILVGHSMGGDLVNLYASRFPADVSGLVLIEASNEDQWSQIPGLIAQWKGFDRDCQGDVWKTRLGWTMFNKDPLPNYVPSINGSALVLSHFPKAAQATCNEMHSIIGAGAFQIATARAERKIPAIIISGGKNIFETDTALPDRIAAGMIWKTLQGETCRLFAPSVQMFAKQSGHFVQFDQPDMVVAQIHRFVGGDFDPSLVTRTGVDERGADVIK